MENLKMETPDIVAENMEKIGALFPAAVTEMRGEDGKLRKGIDFEKLKQLLSRDIVDGGERYEFSWVGKKAAMAEAAHPTTETLRPVKADSRNWDTTENLYIEGDNLAVLKILQESYLGKVKMIYIDPPYNTGNDFIYADDFMRTQNEENEQMGMFDEDENRMFKNTDTNGHFHSDWCSMVYARLMIARNLLSSDGLVFISIDDCEVENLKKICDEIFGSANFRSLVTVMANPGGRDYGGIAKTTEYMLIYAKSVDAIINKIPDENHVFDLHDDLGPFELRELRNRNTVFNDKNRPNLCYPFYLNPNSQDEFGLFHLSLEPDNLHTVKVMPLVSNGIQTVWRWGKEEKARKNLNINIKGKLKQDGSYMIVEKYRDENIMVKNTWTDKKYRTENGSIQIRSIFGSKGTFSYPKPVEIPLTAIEMASSKNDIILDFFSGSATTAHAVMQLNAEDGGHRKFIMVQLPELCDEKSEAYKAGYKNICEIGKERIRRAGDKIKTEHPDADLDIGFRVFRVDSSNMRDVFYKPEEFTQTMLSEAVSNIKPDHTDLDLLYSCLLDCGVAINLPHTTQTVDGCTIHNVDNGALMACFDEHIPQSVIRAMAAETPLQAIFRDSAFAADADKINVTEIFKNLSPDTKVRVI